MKLLLENWRKFLDEQELSETLTKDWGDWTVSDLQDLINISREGEENEKATGARAWIAKTLGLAALKGILAWSGAAAAGAAIQGGQTLTSLYSKQKETPKDPDTLEDFPILDILNMDPHLIHTVEDDILGEIDEEYQKYLGGLSPDTLVKNVVGINDFIAKWIASKTENHVVISDKSRRQK